MDSGGANSGASSGGQSNLQLQYNMKNSHQISQGQIPTANQIIGISNPDEDQMRQTMGKIQRPKISKQMPAPFNLITKQGMKKGKKNFAAFKQEQEQRQQQNDNFFIDKLDDAVNAEEYKQMQNLLQPIQLDRAHTKIDQYQSNLSNPAAKSKKVPKPNIPVHGGHAQHGPHALTALDPLPQIDGISHLLQMHNQNQVMNLSSAFSNYDSYPLGKNMNAMHQQKIMQVKSQKHNSEMPVRLDQMITLGVFKSGSGTIKKMLHAPSLKIYAVKEVPIANVQIRQMLIDWIANWQHNCCYSQGTAVPSSVGTGQQTGYSASDSFIKIHHTQWNSPEGCVSVIADYAANGSIYNLTQSIGAIPESILKHLAKQILRALDFMHEQGITHSNICASQIVFDRKGRTKLSAGFAHILRYKQEVQSTLNQHNSLVQILQDQLENYKNRQSLIKQKFSHLGANQIDGGPPASLMQQSYANNFSQEACVKELKKQDLFDLGILIVLAATGGLEMIDEEFLARIPNIQTSCCMIHALKNYSAVSEKQDKQILTMIKIFNRLSENCQDFLCCCMQQRFSKNEQKKYQITKVCSASDLRNHIWITDSQDEKNQGNDIKKKKSQFNLHNDGNIAVILSLKELLNMSTDWMDTKQKPTSTQTTATGSSSQRISSDSQAAALGNIPNDFQSSHIDRIIDALTLALPGGGYATAPGQSSGGSSIPAGFSDSDIKELSYDLGVDARILKYKLQQHFANQQPVSK